MDHLYLLLSLSKAHIARLGGHGKPRRLASVSPCAIRLSYAYFDKPSALRQSSGQAPLRRTLSTSFSACWLAAWPGNRLFTVFSALREIASAGEHRLAMTPVMKVADDLRKKEFFLH